MRAGGVERSAGFEDGVARRNQLERMPRRRGGVLSVGLSAMRSRDGGAGSAPRLSESLGRALPRLRRLFVPVFRWRRRDQGVEQRPGGPRHVVDRAIEGGLVREGRLVEAADLPNELEGRGAYFLVRRGGREIEERLDVSAHGEGPFES